MTIQRNIAAPTGAVDPEDISIGALLAELGKAAELPLVFVCEGRELQSGYHVTEVKAGRFDALDCGANPESWTEIFIQLWDVDDAPDRMTAGRFLKIIGKVVSHVALEDGAKLTFEVSDGLRPMQLYRAALPQIGGDRISVALSPRPASCKPRDRWLQDQAGGASTGAKPCCGG